MHQLWTYDADRCWRIDGIDCWVWINARPAYCDRGRWLAHLEVRPGAHPHKLYIDAADMWPRYYFDLDRAKLEIEAWLKNRRQYRERSA